MLCQPPSSLIICTHCSAENINKSRKGDLPFMLNLIMVIITIIIIVIVIIIVLIIFILIAIDIFSIISDKLKNCFCASPSNLV